MTFIFFCSECFDEFKEDKLKRRKSEFGTFLQCPKCNKEEFIIKEEEN